MRSPEEILQSALAQFKATLSEHQVLEDQLQKFTGTTAKDVKIAIAQIQNALEQDKSLMNLARFERFVTAYEQFDEVCQAMELGYPELSGFIWGPPRFILQARAMVDQVRRRLTLALTESDGYAGCSGLCVGLVSEVRPASSPGWTIQIAAQGSSGHEDMSSLHVCRLAGLSHPYSEVVCGGEE